MTLKHFSLVALLTVFTLTTAQAARGDTTWVQAFHGEFTGYGAVDSAVVFPDGSTSYRKILMIVTIGEYSCGGSGYCHQWDYDVENYVMTSGGDTLELGRFITPYATAGTPGFSASWQQPYVFDVTDYYQILKDSANIQTFYSGYSYGFTGDVKFAFIEGTPEWNVLGHVKLWNSTYSYGNLANPIDSNIRPYSLIPPDGTLSTEMKFLITGHGYDSTSGCCEFDNTGVGHTYTVLANNLPVAQCNMNVNCGMSEIYPQGGTWAYQRAGNWCPGGSVNMAQYPLSGVTAGVPFTTDVNFDDSYNGGNSFGIYKIASVLFYYGAYNKTLDASLEDIIAPTNSQWYKRENPRVSQPVIKVRNTGGTIINSILIQYGVQDSVLAQYIWTGSLAPSADTIISLPPVSSLTNLSLNGATGNHNFIAEIVQVNGQTDDDQSNDTLTSQFTVAPSWPAKFSINLLTSSFGADGNFGTNPSDASWQITDENNNVVASRTNTDVVTTYKDTVTLTSSGFYTLTVSTTQCFGLSWWVFEQPSPNNTPGYTPGSIYVWDVTKHVKIPVNGDAYSGEFHDDFGCGFVQYFTTIGQCQPLTPTVTVSNDTLTASPGTSYQWYKNGNPIKGAYNQTYTLATHNGNYTVAVTDSAGCTATSASLPFSLDFFAAGINDLSKFADDVSIFPNPASDVVNLVVSAELTSTQYALYDVTGRKLISGIIQNETTPISVRGISSGIYLITISDGVSRITRRVAIQR